MERKANLFAGFGAIIPHYKLILKVADARYIFLKVCLSGVLGVLAVLAVVRPIFNTTDSKNSEYRT